MYLKAAIEAEFLLTWHVWIK